MTHLGVDQNKIVNISSFTIANDNSGGNKFFYDRQNPFNVPKGWSFVVTDVIVEASPIHGPIPASNRYILAVISFTNGGERTFHASFLNDDTRHFPLSGGYVIPSGHTPEFRNTTFSTSYAEAQLLGYFVKGNGLPPGGSLFPGSRARTSEVEKETALFRKTQGSGATLQRRAKNRR